MSSLLPEWAEVGIDLQRPSSARMYDYFLGGSHNFEVDRAAADHAVRLLPGIPSLAIANRAFLHRAVRFMVDRGIRQFLDIGSGIPTVGNVHDVAQAACPRARVVYVDVDPVAVAHSRSILALVDGVGVIQADLRDIDAVLEAPETLRLIDFSEPVGVLLVAVLHFVPETDNPGGVLRRLYEATVPGSYLALTHGVRTGRGDVDEGLRTVLGQSAQPPVGRDVAGVRRLFDGWDLVEPGLVLLPEWRPDHEETSIPTPLDSAAYGGVAVHP